MASVTFPPALGGDGSTVTDDDNPNTGLGNDGHRVRFVPALRQTVVMTGTAVQAASDAHSSRLIASQAGTQAVSARVDAQKAATTATQAAAQADASAQRAAAISPNPTAGLAATTTGQYFSVPEAGYMQLYRNSNGAAEPVFKIASQETLQRLNDRPDPLLTSLIF